MNQKFRNRSEAGKKLAEEIHHRFPKIENGIVLALPRGGVILGAEIAKTLDLPLDIIVTRKIGAPMNPEYAIAAVSEHEIIVSNRENPDKKYLDEETEKERQEIARRLREYRGNKLKVDLKGKTIILVDDGLATGLTMEATIKETKSHSPRKIIIAVPVTPPETVEKLKSQVDEIIVLNIEPMFYAVGQFYESFPQVSDEEVKRLLGDF